MGHDATKVQMGTTKSSYKVVTNAKGEILAGKIVRVNSLGAISTLLSDGGALGVSLGKDLSNAGHTAVVRNGLEVPLLLTAAFTPVIGAQVSISDTTGLGIAAGAGATATKAIYSSGLLSGVQEDATLAPCALIDMSGGL